MGIEPSRSPPADKAQTHDNRAASRLSTQIDADHSSKPINDIFWRRLLILSNLWIARHFQNRSIVRLTPWSCIKFGRFRSLAEASTLRYLAQNTSIPVPKLYCSFQRKGVTYLVMERINGELLTTTWPHLSDSSRAKILGRLREIITEMRALPAPSSRISNVDGGSLWDCRLPSGLDRFGPFKNIQDFHAFLRNGVEKGFPDYPEIDEMIELQKQEWGHPVFTHGDLSSLNILLRGDDIVGIVDWETAGWWPPYWEYTTACQVNPRNAFWGEYIDKFLDPWPEALKMERVRQRWWGSI